MYLIWFSIFCSSRISLQSLSSRNRFRFINLREVFKKSVPETPKMPFLEFIFKHFKHGTDILLCFPTESVKFTKSWQKPQNKYDKKDSQWRKTHSGQFLFFCMTKFRTYTPPLPVTNVTLFLWLPLVVWDECWVLLFWVQPSVESLTHSFSAFFFSEIIYYSSWCLTNLSTYIYI